MSNKDIHGLPGNRVSNMAVLMDRAEALSKRAQLHEGMYVSLDDFIELADLVRDLVRAVTL